MISQTGFWPAVLREIVARVVLLAFFGGAVLLLVWSVFFRSEEIQTLQKEMQRISILDNEVNQIEFNWSQERSDSVDERMASAELLLFRDQAEIDDWMQLFAGQAEDFGLTVTFQLLDQAPLPSAPEEIALLPVRLELQRLGAGSGFEPALRLIEKHLATIPKRIVISHLEARGTGIVLNQLHITCVLWLLKESS